MDLYMDAHLLNDGNEDKKTDEELCKKQKLLSAEDFAMLFSFNLNCEDDGYVANKEDIQRMSELGVIQNLGFGRYRATSFGHWLIETEFSQNPTLPLKTEKDFNELRKMESNNLI